LQIQRCDCNDCDPKVYPGILIGAARRALKQAVLGRIAGRKLTPQQFWLVVNLDEHPGVSQAELAALVRVDAPTVSRALSALAQRSLVRADPDSSDRRRTCVSLTPAGRRLATELLPVAREIRAAVVRGMSAEEVAALTTGLQRVVENLQQLDRQQAERERA
jgi:DNA-binding MarR family transcriptional regulator